MVDQLPLIGLLALAVFFWADRRRYRALSEAALFLFAGMLFPVLGFLGDTCTPLSSRSWRTISSIFRVCPCWPWPAPPGPSGSIAAVAMRSASWPRCGGGRDSVVGAEHRKLAGTYRDTLRFYATILSRNSGSWMAHNNLGAVLEQAGHTAVGGDRLPLSAIAFNFSLIFRKPMRIQAPPWRKLGQARRRHRRGENGIAAPAGPAMPKRGSTSAKLWRRVERTRRGDSGISEGACDSDPAMSPAEVNLRRSLWRLEKQRPNGRGDDPVL